MAVTYMVIFFWIPNFVVAYLWWLWSKGELHGKYPATLAAILFYWFWMVFCALKG